MQLRILSPNGQTENRSLAAAIVRLGRDPACEVAFDPADYPKVSGEHARIERTASGLILTPRSQSNKTLLNDHPISEPTVLKAGDRIRLGFTGPTIEIVSESLPSAPSAGKDSPVEKFGVTVQADSRHLELLRGSMATQRFDIGTGGTIGRERQTVQFPLDHPHVSRWHARLNVEGEQVMLADLGSTNGTYVNGRRISQPIALSRGDRIDIGPFSLQFDGEALVSRSRSNNIELAGRKLRRVVKERATGKPLTLLHDIDLVVRPREFVCLLGPSGSGKSTLLAILSGRNPPDGGAVAVNNANLYANLAALKQDIAVVPQKDVLHESLTVGSALRYSAELRLPSDTGRKEIESNVSAILEAVGLTKQRNTLIRHLSGGQVKRASLANELMCRPSLLFIDEATSGLDEQTDREMMELFHQVADSGKTVVCITHNLANVEAACHLVVILTEGGRMAFAGTPDEAKSYFDVSRLGEVYRKLGERKAEEWQAAFQIHPLHTHYVQERAGVVADIEEEKNAKGVPGERTGAGFIRQAWVLTRRYVSIWRGDLPALAAMLGQSLLVAVLLGIVFGRLNTVADAPDRVRRTVNLLFLLNVSCFWFGCNNAAKELVKERVIYLRERAFNLRIDSYFLSKFLVLVVIGLIQAAMLLGIVRLWCGPPGGMAQQGLVLAALAVAGTALGLLISALARTEEVAVALVPIAIIPQIILAGVIAPLSGLGKFMADSAITARWGERALETLLPEEDRTLLRIDRIDYRWLVAVIAAHVLVFVAFALLALWRQGRAKGNL